MWLDASTNVLVVTLLCAEGLVPRKNGDARNSYAKVAIIWEPR